MAPAAENVPGAGTAIGKVMGANRALRLKLQTIAGLRGQSPRLFMPRKDRARAGERDSAATTIQMGPDSKDPGKTPGLGAGRSRGVEYCRGYMDQCS